MLATTLVGLVLAMSQCVQSHRMCLNYESPVRMEESFALCRDFETFGCCSREQDADLHQKYLAVAETLSHGLSTNCSKVITDLLCQVCSEYSAHRYDFEKTGKSRSLPGLCKDYCHYVFENCREAVALITDDRKLLNFIENNNKEEFCDAVTLPDTYYCFPPKNEYSSGYVLEFSQQTNEKPCSNLCVEEVANRIYSPTSIKHARDETHRLFVTEQRGIAWIYLPNRDKLHPPFLNISTKVACRLDGYDERGFLDIEFHPNYTDNRMFYVYYNVLKDQNSNYIRISEMKVSIDDMNQADTNYERVLLEVFQPYQNHNGGQMLFGPDGYLYLFIGDGGAGGDPHNNAQNMSSLLGKVLRIDPRPSNNNNKSYSIPNDNPFVSHRTARPEIYAYGVRNPWKCSFNPKGRLYCGDVGQSTREEINIIIKGGNYGWRAFEADLCYDEDMCYNTTIVEDHIPPIYSYGTSFGRSITGGYEYRGCMNSKLKGSYFYGDFMSGRIGMLRANKRGEWIPRNVCMFKKSCEKFGKQHKYPRYIQTFGEDEAGELYFAASTEARPGSRGGRIFKLSQSRPTNCISECSISITRPTVISQNSHRESYSILPGGEVEIRLAGSDQTRVPTKGRVEIRPKRGRWSTVCGDSFTIENAHVICRMLGFIRAREFSIGEFGPGRGKIRFKNLQCLGTEDHIDECTHSGWQPVKSCKHIRDACVWCETYTFASLP